MSLKEEADLITCLGLSKLKIQQPSLIATGLLAEYFRSKNLKTRVIGCPKTIGGDLKCKEVPTSFGFDTTCKVLGFWHPPVYYVDEFSSSHFSRLGAFFLVIVFNSR
ncbi:hypothetical protein L1987_82954 [Smallanthus sonchifolius]|uniref:Uncharacterized protein n=1 Tax=Smallanthus sonchifolius TaxID=185202 RepID=A0ACB8YFK6_9ASTR|nr:hypothetical protein L1987_82954 [Smallanthus sonchifolius]